MYDCDNPMGFSIVEDDNTDLQVENQDSYRQRDCGDDFYRRQGLRYSTIVPYVDEYDSEETFLQKFSRKLNLNVPGFENVRCGAEPYCCSDSYPQRYQGDLGADYYGDGDLPGPDSAGMAVSNFYMPDNPFYDNEREFGHRFHHSFYPETQTRLLKFHNQSFHRIRDYCLQSRTLFTDPTFPPNQSSLNWRSKDGKPVIWKRIHQLSPNPQFIVDVADSRFDLDQGKLGNCWFVAAATAITMRKTVFSWVVPHDQSTTHNYAGVFHFRFWVFGSWYDIVVDDYLPVDQATGKLIFVRNRQTPNEFWSPLLEKAYAKLYGNYGNLDGGFTVDAFVDMTGGIGEVMNIKALKNTLDNLFIHMLQSYRNKSLMGCNVAKLKGEGMTRLPNGLVRGHAYTITEITSVRPLYDPNAVIHLIRIRNPWGNHIEWNGAWSDNSSEWSLLSEADRMRLNGAAKSDGESWMSFEDFFQNFDIINMCHLTPNAFLENQQDPHSFKQTMYFGEWVRYISAGGSGSEDPSSFWKNPQYVIRIRRSDRYGIAGKAALIVSLMQMTWRNAELGTKNEYIQFRLFKIKPDVYGRPKKKYNVNDLVRVGSSGAYTNMREVSKVFYVPVGLYVIIPSTFEPERENKFLLRIFTEEPIMSKYFQPQSVPSIAQYGELRDAGTMPEDCRKVPWESMISNLFLSDARPQPAAISMRVIENEMPQRDAYGADANAFRNDIRAIDHRSLCSIM